MNLTRFGVLFPDKRVFRKLPSPYTPTFNKHGYCAITAPPGGTKPKVRKSKTTTKTFLDLPAAYITPAGKEVIPLAEFVPGFVLGMFTFPLHLGV